MAEGRPRSEQARTAILDAAWSAFTESGLPALTIEAIAARAGVGKTTIYRWWPSKSAVVLDALQQRFEPRTAFPDTGSVRTDLVRQLRAVIRLLRTPEGAAYLALVAESHHDDALAEALGERYLSGRRDAAAEVVRRGVDRGELAPDTDAALLIDTVYGALYYRLLVAHDPPALTYAERVVDQALAGVLVR